MKYSCPECKSDLNFDVSEIELVLLRMKCAVCGKILSMGGNNNEFVESEDKKLNLERLKDLINVAWSDGKITAEEKMAIMERGRDLGVEENIINQILSDIAMNKIASSHQLIKEYDEDLKEYLNSEHETYDLPRFIGKISILNVEDINLKKYREDLLKMLNHNSDAWMERARFWESIYNDSTLETEWRQAREHMQKCIGFSEDLRGLYDHVYSLNKKDLVKFSISFSQREPGDWD